MHGSTRHCGQHFSSEAAGTNNRLPFSALVASKAPTAQLKGLTVATWLLPNGRLHAANPRQSMAMSTRALGDRSRCQIVVARLLRRRAPTLTDQGQWPPMCIPFRLYPLRVCSSWVVDQGLGGKIGPCTFADSQFSR